MLYIPLNILHPQCLGLQFSYYHGRNFIILSLWRPASNHAHRSVRRNM